MTKYFKVPFANSGDKTTIPDDSQPSGVVNFTDGYTPDYEKDQSTDPDAKDVSRQSENYFKFAVTEALKEIQEKGGKIYDTLVNYLPGAIIIGSDNNYYRAITANGPDFSPVVDPVGDTTGTWVSYILNHNSITSLRARPITQVENEVVNVTGYWGDANENYDWEFEWDDSDLSTEVSSDTYYAFYVAPNSDLTGASGAWKRIHSENVDIRWFGAPTTIENTERMQAYIDYCGSFFSPATSPRKSPLKIYFPYGVYEITAPLTFNFGAGEFSGVEVYGDNVIQGSIIKGTHQGPLFSYEASEHVEVHHISFFGQNCTAIAQINLSAYTNAAHIHHCEFNANLADCLHGNFILSTIEHNLFGYYGIPTTNHRHILNDGVVGGNASNSNVVRHNKFAQATANYCIDITSGNKWVFDDNEFEGNSCPTMILKGVETALFINNWWENNAVLSQGATPWEIKVEDTGGVESRLIEFRNNQMGATIDHDYWVHATTTSDKLKIIVQSNIGNSFPAGFAFTNYDTVNDKGIVKWEYNTLSGYSRSDFNITTHTADAFSARATSNATNATGDGTSYTVVYGTVDTGNVLGAFDYTTGTHTAATTGIYHYNATVELNNANSAHTTGWIELVTTARTYRRQINPYAMSIPGTYVGINIVADTWMTAGETAYINVVVGGSTKTVTITGTGSQVKTFFGGHRIYQG